MNEELVNGLRKLLLAPNSVGRHIVTWYDENGENRQYLDEIKEALGDVEIVVFNDNPLFVRHHVLHEVPTENVIIYRNTEQPERLKNQLIDLELANPQDIFIPDESTLVLNALELSEIFRSTVKRNNRFFKNQKRKRDIKKFFPLSEPNDLQMAIYAVSFDAEDRRLERVLTSVFVKYRESRDEFSGLLKFIDHEALTEMLDDYFGLKIVDIEQLDTLWDSVLITYFKSTLTNIELERYASYLLPNHGNVRIFTRDLMKLLPDEFSSFSAEISGKYGLDKVLSELELANYIDCDAVAIADDLVISELIVLLSEKKDISEQLRSREVGFYYDVRQFDYQMLSAANNFIIVTDQLMSEIKITDKDAAIKYYADELYQVDTAYRHFNYYYDHVSQTDEYMNLSQQIEYLYCEEWILKLADKWEHSVEDENWTSTKYPMLSEFYGRYLQPLDDKKDRVFIIVSDGLRYEVAKEIADQTNLVNTGADISTSLALSLLPSVTPVGMAALLPHDKLEFGDTILADGLKTDASNRDKILKSANKDNLAIKYEDVRSMKKSEWKSFFSGKKYVYIYHDKIDITGEHDDSATFSACNTAIDEISSLIVELHTTFSGVNVFVTADHGFFYQTGTIESRRKMSKVVEADKLKARYAITDKPDPIALSYRLSDMFDGNEKYVNTPHANVVFAKQGGVGRYYHGGSLPQEVIVPILNFKSSRNSTVRDKVNITYAGISLKITNTITYLTFRQNEPVSVDKVATRYKAWFEDADSARISDEITIIADSSEKDVNSREYREKFVFAARTYDPNGEYYLVVKDENDIETDRIAFKVDIAIMNDLGL